jgi:Na+/phosphate symporter
MFGMTQKRMEQIATKTAILIGISISIFGVLLIIDSLLGVDFFSPRMEKFGLAIIGIASIILAVCIFISAMLNISRIAESIEKIADKWEK